ncbi:MAG: hypothetical protein SGILL_010578, partial [Bacillariaceae sp.]
RLSPADLVGLPVIFTDGNEGTIIGVFSEKIVHSQKELDEIRFKIELDGEIVVKAHGEFKDDIAWPIRDISDHAGPLKTGDELFRGSLYSIRVHWKQCGSTGWNPSWEALETIAEGDRETCIRYAKKNNLLNVDGWIFLDDKDEDEDEDLQRSESEAQEEDEEDSVTASTNSSEYAEEEDADDNDEGEPEDDDEWENSLVAAVSQDSTFASAGGFNLFGDRLENDGDSCDGDS